MNGAVLTLRLPWWNDVSRSGSVRLHQAGTPQCEQLFLRRWSRSSSWAVLHLPRISARNHVCGRYIRRTATSSGVDSRLHAKIKEQEQLYTRLRASQSFEELERKIRLYEERREQSGIPATP